VIGLSLAPQNAKAVLCFPHTPRGQAEVRWLPDMPSPGATAPPRMSIEDSYLELLAETLEGLDLSARSQFLQRYFKAITHLDLSETQCVQLWDDMLTRRRELGEHLGRQVSLKTALMDVLESAGLFRVPILIEYEELKKLQVNAVTDPLTGLYNRRLFSEAFEKELNRARRYGLPLGLVMLDLHRFKEVNDKHGHPRGDEVLRLAATTLKKTLRTSDSAFRIGGDEFALLLPQTDAAQALALSRRVGTVFAESIGNLRLTVRVSVDHGVATFPQDGDQADQLIHVADERLYHVKHANHNAAPAVSPVAEVPQSPVTMPSNQVPMQSQPAPRPAPLEPKLEPKPSAEKTEVVVATTTVSVSPAVVPATQPSAPAPRTYAIQRKAERVSMMGTNAYAILGEPGGRRARVLDLGFGGVALELDTPNHIPETIVAVLHVPILPPVRVNLKPVWSQRTSLGGYRVGCAFVS
jgi:diguanylate cyclase (GGDEF)-like protein